MRLLQRRRSGGYSLLEMVVAVGLTGLLVSIAGRVILSSVQVQSAVHDAAWTQDRLDHLLDALRADVWGASDIAAMGGGENDDGLGLALTISAGSSSGPATVRWSVESDPFEAGVADNGEAESRWLLIREGGNAESPERIRRFALPPMVDAPRLLATGDDAVRLEMDGAAWTLRSEWLRLKEVGTR